jgi:hypothetical protein
MRSYSNIFTLIVFPMFVYFSHIHRNNLKDITKRYLTHLSDEELDRELSLVKGSFFSWNSNTANPPGSLIQA